MARAFLGLGGNLGDQRALLNAALEKLAATPGIKILAVSRFYRTPPWGKTDQDWFLNAAAALETSLSPHALLEACLVVESTLGRQRHERWGPRSVDIDLLALDDLVIRDAVLTLPHPHLFERAFVLVPLAAIAPDLVIGGRGIADALRALDTAGIELDVEAP